MRTRSSRANLTLNVASLRKDSRTVGPGVRDAIWLQGCVIGCPGCANEAYLSHEPRVELTVQQLLDHLSMRVGRICGCTVSGGEPTEQAEAVTALFCGVKALGLSTVLYTGRTLESLHRDPAFSRLLAHTDLLIDGPFIQDQQDLSLQWRGSRNQRVICLSDYFGPDNLNEARPNGEIVLSLDHMTFTGIGTRTLSQNAK